MRTLLRIHLGLFVSIYGLGAYMQYSNGVEITWGMNVVLAGLLLLPGFLVGLVVVGIYIGGILGNILLE